MTFCLFLISANRTTLTYTKSKKKKTPMDTARISESIRERSRRPIRNKRYTRRAYGEDKRPPKRLFTPEIKRFLKDWLVRRRENPYPNRDEKKTLAVQTGLTYIQVCNWFANWRRKLKNAGKEPQRKTWGDLIKTYNSQVQGNVEHFSICSDDSIWEEPESGASNYSDSEKIEFTKLDHHHHHHHHQHQHHLHHQPDHSYTFQETVNNNNNSPSSGTAVADQNQCYFISSTTETEAEANNNPFSQSPKYKNHIMEKYLRDCQKPEADKNRSNATGGASDGELTKPSMISKWLESAVNFRPSENNYLHWTFTKNPKKKKINNKVAASSPTSAAYPVIHGREELDAAEALTRLANANRKV